MAVTAVTIAQDGAPPSLCTDGTWNCSDPNNSDRESWNWTCGWYWGHYNVGEYSIDQIPEWCGRPVGPAPGCYDSNDPGWPDQRYSGPLNTLGNVTYWTSTDGTCSGREEASFTWIQTTLTLPADVIAFCQSISLLYDEALHLSTVGYSVPSDIWLCGY